LWTLDDDGKLCVWPPDETGSPNMKSTQQSFLIPKGHSFSIVVGDQLWVATGKDIRVFNLNIKSRSTFQILQKPLNQPGVGEVTSGTVVNSHPDRIFFGHNDGKVTIYSHQDFACLGVINVSLYKINSLTGVGNNLWAAYNTGMIYVYDINKSPWKVEKDWRAHDDPVVSVLVDRSSIWKINRLQVASLGADAVIRIWDGTLQDDWLGLFLDAPNSISLTLYRE